MRAVDIIIKKRDKQELTRQEIDYLINGFTHDEIPDYQMSAWAMAVLLNGMSSKETTDLTMAIAHSGELLDLSDVVPLAVDKHSTGGVGDKTTLVVEPIVAACGLPIAKMSGHGLGFSGGTLDKMESIPGFRVDLTTQEFTDQLRTIGLVLTGQTSDLAPADGKLYALRDVTGTVQSIPLIASSVMSKKIAAGAQVIVLDVKVGLGAFMATLADGRALAELMVSIAELAGRKAVALLSDMNQPLGHAVGNALEVYEAIQTLNGSGPPDFREHCLLLAGLMLTSAGYARDDNDGRRLALNALDNGQALVRFKALVAAQGGDVQYVDNPELLCTAPVKEIVPAPRSGYLRVVNARIVGETAVQLGAGRVVKGASIDHAVGIEILHKVGDHLAAGQPLFIIHARKPEHINQARQDILAAHSWSDESVERLPLIYGIIR